MKSLPKHDARLTFIYDQLTQINKTLVKLGGGLSVFRGKIEDVFKAILKDHRIKSIFFNEDYEPYAIKRDAQVKKLCEARKCQVNSFKDQVIFAKSDIIKSDGKPYSIYTPYMRQWRQKFESSVNTPYKIQLAPDKLAKANSSLPTLKTLGLTRSKIKVRPFDFSAMTVQEYSEKRNFPSENATSFLSPHLRFGTIGIRTIIQELVARKQHKSTFLNELIWREFFMQIFYHFPESQTSCFKAKYEHIKWRNDESEFKKWCNAETGYPLVDAGMTELNKTGYMHNRVRMVVASFLCKHLLIDWRWGEAYFAEKLLDYESASNVGNWQWAAGCGCDAAPYFRVFNPHIQLDKFDKQRKYVRKWLGDIEMRKLNIPEIVEHKFARNRAIETYKAGLTGR